ncbi:hypothetical protein Nepgr_007900 [Nepenthes gracilis]|uniref:Uncharacterized protein n=1 Tax=Nepenthes gracilis TaxID=150966 RepID=A0AAD3XIW2_NEPGR|nr:hypothetical protein Nepgr_007900 [Nepenthes gracilis]
MDPLVVYPPEPPLTSRASHFAPSSLESPLLSTFHSDLAKLLLADGAEDCPISSSVSSLGVPACSVSDSGSSQFVSPHAKGAHCASQSSSIVLGSDSNLTVHDAPRCSVLPLVCPNTGEQVAPVQHEIVHQIGVTNLMSTNLSICPGDLVVTIGSSPTKSWSEVAWQSNSGGVALGSEKEDQFPLTKTGTGLHTTMVMEPLGERFTRNDCPASVGYVSDEVNGNLVSSSGQNAQWITSSIQDRLSATATGKLKLRVVK